MQPKTKVLHTEIFLIALALHGWFVFCLRKSYRKRCSLNIRSIYPRPASTFVIRAEVEKVWTVCFALV